MPGEAGFSGCRMQRPWGREELELFPALVNPQDVGLESWSVGGGCDKMEGQRGVQGQVTQVLLG